MTNNTPPLLSICIPTYNRGHLLEVMLEALLPQAREHASEVEVIISDNASTDNTESIISDAQKTSPVKYFRNESNEGVIANIVKLPLQYAKGKYIWILGDHNLLRPGALAYLLKKLKARPELKIFYANFVCAKYPEQWPDKIKKEGYTGPYDYLGNENTGDRDVDEWSELITAESALATQLYAHIVRKEVWASYWNERKLPLAFQNAEGTYPHTYMIVKMLFKDPGYYIGNPLICIYNGAQHWGSPARRIEAYLLGLPSLISLFKRKGLDSTQLGEALNWNKRQVKKSLPEFFSTMDKRHRKVLRKSIFKNLCRPWILGALFHAFVDSRCCFLARILNSAGSLINSLITYVFRNSRPARWIRKQSSLKNNL